MAEHRIDSPTLVRAEAAAKSPRGPALRLAAAMAILGTVGAFTIEGGQDAVTSVFWRCVFGALFLMVWTLARGEFRAGVALIRARPAQGGRILAVSLCQIVSWIAFFASFSYTTLATTTIVYHVYPFLILGIGAIVLRERIPMAQLGWIGVAFVGLVLASGTGGPTHDTGARHAHLLGIGLSLGAALAYAAGIMLSRGVLAPPPFTTLCQSLLGVLLLAPLATLHHALSWQQLGWLVGLGVIHTGIAYTLTYSAYPKLSAPIISGIAFLYPLVAIIIDWTCYHHALSIAGFIGLGLIGVATVGSRLGWRFRLPLRRRRCAA